MEDDSLIKHKRSIPYNPNNTERARKMRQDMTRAEKKLWFEILKDFKYRVYRQRPIHHYIVDFYCAKLKLVIEVDGDSHYSDEAVEYDNERTRVLDSLGIKVLRVSNNDVLSNISEVYKIINSFCGTVGGSP